MFLKCTEVPKRASMINSELPIRALQGWRSDTDGCSFTGRGGGTTGKRRKNRQKYKNKIKT